ncbi:MAG: efflux RND transporter permease subunit, partial [Deltaproteobacteria bacterium]|nr:efflux RND transporter permease subunit [Deltaproteobacteria bacterium]
AREFEIHIEVPQARLREHNITLEDVARTVNQAALERGGGSIKAQAGEILLRVQERRDWAREFADIPLIAGASGAVVRLGDVANVKEGFENSDRFAAFNGERAIGIAVDRVGDQSPTGVSNAVRAAMPEIVANLPPSIRVAIQNDDSQIYRERLELLLKNASLGLILVMAVLSLFLQFKLAFWVTMGIPTAFIGTFVFLPNLDVSINMISMFAFILALGIVVDDAIVAGENIYEYRQRGMGLMEAAICGARDIARPIGFSILTNIVAFIPLWLVPGGFGKIWAVIPAVVATTFIISWIEALFILPAHLAHVKNTERGRISALLNDAQQRFSRGFNGFIDKNYGRALTVAIRQRYLTVALAIGILILVLAFPMSGRMGFILMPQVESDFALASGTLPVGSPSRETTALRDRLVAAGQSVIDEHGKSSLGSGIFALVDENRVEVRAYLAPAGKRPLSTARVVQLWREKTGDIPGLEMLRFASDSGGPGGGPSVSVEISHRDIAMLEQAASEVAARLAEFGSTKDVDDGFTPGKSQLDFQLTEEARSLGVTAAEIARQVRNAFYGAEAIKQQRGRNEVTVLARLPAVERGSESDVENLVLRTPAGGEVPLYQVARVNQGRAYTEITRRNGRRTVTATANVEPIGDTSRILAALTQEVLPELTTKYPGLTYSFEGSQADMRDAIQSFLYSVTLALLGIYILLAIPFRSYAQPLVVMTAIPFGVVGAIIGHMIMGYNLSIISVMGMIALGGVVVNDALVMIDFANQRRDEGANAFEAIQQAGLRRFRPILLTTLTTFGGLAPMIFETSRQARFLIPMALSLGYGILFSTAIILVLIPCLYLIVDDWTPAPREVAIHGTSTAM